MDGTASGDLTIDQLQNEQYKTVFNGELNDVVINIKDDLPLIKNKW